MSATNFLPPIPEGYQTYKRMLFVAGITFRKNDASPFIKSGCGTLEFEREPDNPKDKYAIKVIGITPTARYFIGYVPKEISKHILKTGSFDKVKPRLDRTYHGIVDFLEVRFQVIGLKEHKKIYDSYIGGSPAHAHQKMAYKYFGLAIPRGLTAVQAGVCINEHLKKLEAEDPPQIKEFYAYQNIHDDFDNADFREMHEIKKPSVAALNEVLDQLRQEGKSYSYLAQYDDVVIDRILKLKPKLARKGNESMLAKTFRYF
ncbi:MAG: hypothetical protein ACD_23C00070G0004 [uncultured bacterium]|nr:MAG: hypothetical protein ACD_23C00070G0004 [uncultured bacterium]